MEGFRVRDPKNGESNGKEHEQMRWKLGLYCGLEKLHEEYLIRGCYDPPKRKIIHPAFWYGMHPLSPEGLMPGTYVWLFWGAHFRVQSAPRAEDFAECWLGFQAGFCSQVSEGFAFSFELSDSLNC